ncbi:MAG: hypothetical protein ACOC2F_00285 [Bacteroidota bacterium]
MRLIVVYTPAIDAIVSDIRNMINHHILEANTFLEDADVFETWELAYAGLTDYEEEYIPDGDGRFTDLNRFRGTTDGYMDVGNKAKNIVQPIKLI